MPGSAEWHLHKIAELLEGGIDVNVVSTASRERLIYSTDVPLSAGTDFDTPIGGAAGDWIPRGTDTEVRVAGEADQASASGGVVIEESMATTVQKTTFMDGDDGGGGSGAPIAADEGVGEIVVLTRPFWRFRWEDGAVDQGVFSVQVTVR